MSEFNFNGVTAPTAKTFLTPGVYDLQVTSAKYEQPEGKNPWLEVTFSGEAGQTTQKFYLTPKAMDRLVYLHEQLFEKPLKKAFESSEAVATYFQKAFESLKPTKRFLVGGREGTDGRIYANFGYANFVVSDKTPVGAFAEGSAQWISNVERNRDREMLHDKGAMLSADVPASNSDDDDLPF